MNHKIEIYNRALEVGRYVVDTNCTVRVAAHHFEVSKSTIYTDLVDRLPEKNENLATEARKVLDNNKEERHIRGGNSTKKKYLKLKRTI